MSGNWLIFIELLLVFGVAFGWGLNELRQQRKYKEAEKRKLPENSD